MSVESPLYSSRFITTLSEECNRKYSVPAWSHFYEIRNILPFLLFLLKLFSSEGHFILFITLSCYLVFCHILLLMTLHPSLTNGCFNCSLSTLCEALIVPHGATLLQSNSTNKELCHREYIE